MCSSSSGSDVGCSRHEVTIADQVAETVVAAQVAPQTTHFGLVVGIGGVAEGDGLDRVAGAVGLPTLGPYSPACAPLG